MTARSLFLVVMMLITATSYAADSPQFRGANRTGIFDEKGLMKTWPENGPPKLWVTQGIGAGYSSALVNKGRIYVTGT